MKPIYLTKRFVESHNKAVNAYLTLNEDAIILDVNHPATVLLSQTDSDLIGKKLAILIHSADRKKFHINHKYLLGGHRGKKWKVRIKQPLGGYICFDILGISILNDNQSFDVLIEIINKHQQVDQSINLLNKQLKSRIMSHIACLKKNHWQLKQRNTELVNIKQELANKNAVLDSIFNATIEGIVTINQWGTIISTNKAMTTLFGYQQQELIGANISILVPSLHKKQHDYYIKKYLETNISHIIGKVREIEGQCKNGSLLPLDLSIAEFEINRQQYFTGILRDISERKQKEIKDKEHLAELAHVTRLGLMGEVASGIAHEVNQPLTAIGAYTQTCLDLVNNKTCDLSILTEILQKIKKQSIRAGQIIHQLRNLVSSKNTKKSETDINTLITDAVDLCKFDSKQADIIIKYKLASNLPNLFIDAVQIEQVLLNLIKNAFDVLHQIPNHKQRLLEIQTYLTHDHNIEVRIKDFGPGLDEAEQANIFIPFYTSKKTGMGMGLSISRSIVEAHGGILRFNSKKGFGTTFYFILPIGEEVDN